MDEIKLDLNDKVKINEIKEKINLAMFNNPLFSSDDLIFTNALFKRFQNVKV